MTKDEKITLLAETLEADAAQLNEDAALEGLACWDSIAKLSLIVMMDDEFGKKITGDQIRNLRTIGDILLLMG